MTKTKQSKTSKLVDRLLSENFGRPEAEEFADLDVPSPDGEVPGGAPGEDLGLGDESDGLISNESGTIVYTPGETEADGSEVDEVLSFLCAFKEACPDCWAGIKDAVMNDLECGDEGGIDLDSMGGEGEDLGTEHEAPSHEEISDEE